MHKSYYIVGDYNICGKITSCLIILCANKEQAKEDLKTIIANPPKDCLGNIHIESDNSENCWWNQGSLD